MIITFAGHSFILSHNEIKEKVKEQIVKNIVDCESVICYHGGYGNFDDICAIACKELKEEGFKIELVYVTPYISLSEQVKIKELQALGLCDTSIFPPISYEYPKTCTEILLRSYNNFFPLSSYGYIRCWHIKSVV